MGKKKFSDDEEYGNVAWGKQKEAYHGRDVDDESASDDEAARDEEIEAKRLQQTKAAAIRPEDMGIVAPKQTKSAKKSSKKQISSQSGEPERIERDLDTLTPAEKINIIQQDTPELLPLLNDFETKLAELRSFIEPAKQKAASGELSTAGGISYLDAKYFTLLSYITNISYFLLRKAHGLPVKDHPVMETLARLRVILEKLRPLDKKLKYQLDKLLKMASDGEAKQQAAAEDLSFKPRPDEMVAKADDEQVDAGVYKPPKLHAVPYDQDEKTSDKKQRLRDEKRKRVTERELARDLRNEVSERPEELVDNPFALSDEDEGERAKYEESMFTRLQRNKKESKKKRTGTIDDAFADFDDFGDVIADEDDIGRGRNLQRIIAKIDTAANGKKLISGDADIPRRGDQQQRKKRAVAFDDDMGDSDKPHGMPVEEDAFYLAAQDAQERKRKQKEAVKEAARPQPTFFADQVDETGHRHATKTIVKNKGLTPHRPLKMRNPRVRLKEAYKEKMKRRKGAVRESRTEGKGYQGEKTGIRANVSKSTKLRS
eukprot:TRINITY_DN7498_c0_g1_i1.p1 TRINITY_DN7498_c0_g1~~TRINITY_DN7498_c0_g1_i1.p1  ORF type:complete len:543 (+),score=183.80 TRINITY_DN7498_c0_g1_i1:53-1681(+)